MQLRITTEKLILLFFLLALHSIGGSNPVAIAGLSGNPGFENSTTGYSFSSAPPYSINSNFTYIRSGAASLRVSTTSTTDLRASHTAGAITAPSTGFVTVITFVKGENTLLRSKIGVYNATTSTEYSLAGYTTATTGAFTIVSASFSCVAGEIYYPVIFSNSSSGATATGEYDDVVMYFSASSITDVTVPSSPPTTITGSAAGTAITLSWTGGSDAGSGIEGYLVVRLGGVSATATSPLAQVNYSTVSTEGPTAIGTATVVYNGNNTTVTDDPGATGSYTYLVFVRDRAFNYTAAASSARIVVVNGTSLNGSLPSALSVDGLYIAPTCSLTIGAANALTIKTGAAFSVNGTLIDNGGITNNGAITFLNGSTYIFDRNGVTAAVLNATWNTGSTARFTQVRGFVPTGFNQTFADIVWNCPTQNRNVILDNSFNITGTFTLTNTSTRSLTMGNSSISGNIIQNGGTLNFTGGTTLTLNGSSRQILAVLSALESLTINNSQGVAIGSNTTINTRLTLSSGALTDSTFALTMATGSTIEVVAGSISEVPTLAGTLNLIYSGDVSTGNEVPTGGANNVTINTPVAITLASVLRVNGILTFTSGDIISTASNHVLMSAGSSVAGASNTSHVNGTVRKTGNTAFTFPIGNGTTYMAFAISAPVSATDQYTASYTRSNPTTFGTPLGTGILRVSITEYFTLDRTTGTSTVTATLPWVSTSGVTNLADLRVVRWTGTEWTGQGNASTSGTVTQGTITSAGLTGYGTITLGTANAANNPLPVTLMDFSATCNGKSVQLRWATASEINNNYYEILRSNDAIHYYPICRISGAGTSVGKTYIYEDALNENGSWYYKLMQTDFDGTTEELSTIVSRCGQKPVAVTVYNSDAPILRAEITAEGKYHLRIAEINGRIIIDKDLILTKGTNLINLETLPLNVLLICNLSDPEGFKFPVKFILGN